MRIVLGLSLACVLFAAPLAAAETAEQWLERAADPKNSLRAREYAARQVLMLADASASILIAALNNPESGLRRQVAARLLGESGAPGAEAALLEAAFGEDYFLAEAAAASLARLYARLDDQTLYDLYRRGGRAPNAIPGGAAAGEEDWLALSLGQARFKGRFRSFVMHGLALKYGGGAVRMPPRLAECVWEGLNDLDRDLRRHAAEAARHTGSPLAPERLAAFLYVENDPALLVAALRSLAEMRPSEFGEAAERHVGHDDPNVQLEALAALDAMGYSGALFPLDPGMKAVATYVSHPSTPVRRRAAELLGKSRNPAALDYLLVALHDRVGANRAAAARILGEMGFTAAVGGLSPLLRDGRPEVRSEAAVALARLGVLGVSAGALDDLAGDSPPFRRAAAETLGRIGDMRAVPKLLEALGDDDIELAGIAAEALGALGDKRAGRGLYAVMTSGRDAALSDAARRALLEIYLDDPGSTASSWESWARRNRLFSGTP